MARTRTIKVDALARVEGEGSLRLRLKDGVIQQLEFGIFEPPRFFEAFLVGRDYSEAPDITARICGICPIAYQMGAINAMEDALDIQVPRPIRDLRRLIYCGEWIESHGLHVYMLHAPDFLGLADAIELAKVNRPLVEKALRLKQIGNEILAAVGGGRAIHPINLRVGGFYRAPTKQEIGALVEPLKWAVETSLETVRVVSAFEFPEVEQDYTFMALRHEDEYPIHEGRLITNRGDDFPVRDFEDHVDEEHVARSNALHGFMKARGAHHVGPMARYSLNHDRLGATARQAAAEAGLGPVITNPFHSIIVRSVEILQACEDALRLAENYEMPDRPFIEPEPRAAVGYGCTEAPRGICYHRYELAEDGAIKSARIIPPTAQNQKIIESDLWQVVERNLHLPDEDLKWRCEQAIRNYDPCISCATHFLKLEVERE